ncbi:hypothetical protein PPL_05234 [Heterostelium album PN500]|uniref:RNA ligase domain-containing protein n=1 Tax=Heterostelium pallidum (strain ATCC 26659 / Pp 5 / PN500) TaxID=670386 RepID=D3B9T7_HETP5|nr:hypothetical protein PPL_05234 [Heterostelium album PN500]EFA81999.1 hypothetical protein PPL_05234 [Heterostelium album PN500]|eukprot:XP_020434116.1 hypothetical protein PPL_05234 [Heterostelium album PN500]
MISNNDSIVEKIGSISIENNDKPTTTTTTKEINDIPTESNVNVDDVEEEDAQDASDRVLAYVEKIVSLEPIAGADVIEIATVLGWKVIVKKGLYAVGDLVVYVEIDSILPPWPYFINDKLDKCNFRIKTIKLRGQISQGYCIPIKELLNHPNKKLTPVYCVDGQVESGLKSIRRLSDPVLQNGDFDYSLEIKSNMTELIDQPRIQNLPLYPTTYAHVEFEVTEKLEGSSVTVYHYKGVNGTCSRNFELNFENCQKQSEIKDVLVDKMKLYDRLDKLNLNIALQGEFIGPKVQGNIYGILELCWRCFDIWMIDQNRYATHAERVDIMEKLGLPWSDYGVPYLGTYKLEGKTLKDILEMANGFSQLKGSKPKVLREGIVFKSTTVENNSIITFKAISNQYLLKK